MTAGAALPRDAARDAARDPVPAALSPLPGYALFAAVISAAGLPIYIHAPKAYADLHGVGLAALGGVLALLRLVDLVQDPLFGWLSDRLGRWRRVAVSAAMLGMGGAMLGLFAVAPPIAPLAWFAAMLLLLFSGFSFLSINFYALGVWRGSRDDSASGATCPGHLGVAAWRESGALAGICLAAMLPSLLPLLGLPPYAGFAALFALATLAGAAILGRDWRQMPEGAVAGQGAGLHGLRRILGDPSARRLLLIALLNAAPVAVTATLFLYFTESRIGAPQAAGPLLLAFFLAAAVAAPGWAALGRRIGARRALLIGMALSVASFSWALFLGTGDIAAFAAICLISGAALGADMTLLPALFSRRLAEIGEAAATGFGLWSFMSKAALAVAAGALLPILDAAGYSAGTRNGAQALTLLSALYAGVPCALKLAAMGLLARSRL